MPLPISVRPPRPGDGSGICEREPDERERSRERYAKQRDEWAEIAAKRHAERKANGWERQLNEAKPEQADTDDDGEHQ